MSDTVKIIIEIPEDRYADILRIADIQIVRRMPTLEQVVAHGTPLDDVKEPKNGERFSCPNCGFKADWFIPSKQDNTKESK